MQETGQQGGDMSGGMSFTHFAELMPEAEVSLTSWVSASAVRILPTASSPPQYFIFNLTSPNSADA